MDKYFNRQFNLIIILHLFYSNVYVVYFNVYGLKIWRSFSNINVYV